MGQIGVVYLFEVYEQCDTWRFRRQVQIEFVGERATRNRPVETKRKSTLRETGARRARYHFGAVQSLFASQNQFFLG